MLSFSDRSFHLEGNDPTRSPTPFSIARGSLFVQKEISRDEKEFASNERVSRNNETVSEATPLGNSTIRGQTSNKAIFNSSSSVVSIPTHSPTSSVSTTSSSSILSHEGLFGSVSPSRIHVDIEQVQNAAIIMISISTHEIVINKPAKENGTSNSIIALSTMKVLISIRRLGIELRFLKLLNLISLLFRKLRKFHFSFSHPARNDFSSFRIC